MDIEIGAYNSQKGSVPVTIIIDGQRYSRNVNAVLIDGAYDAALTAERVAEVSLAYPAKIAAGVIKPDTD